MITAEENCLEVSRPFRMNRQSTIRRCQSHRCCDSGVLKCRRSQLPFIICRGELNIALFFSYHISSFLVASVNEITITTGVNSVNLNRLLFILISRMVARCSMQTQKKDLPQQFRQRSHSWPSKIKNEKLPSVTSADVFSPQVALPAIQKKNWFARSKAVGRSRSMMTHSWITFSPGSVSCWCTVMQSYKRQSSSIYSVFWCGIAILEAMNFVLYQVSNTKHRSCMYLMTGA